MEILFDWKEEAQCWEHTAEDRVVLIYKHPTHNYFLAIGDVHKATILFGNAGGKWESYPCDSIYGIMEVVERKFGGTVKFRDPNK